MPSSSACRRSSPPLHPAPRKGAWTHLVAPASLVLVGCSSPSSASSSDAVSDPAPAPRSAAGLGAPRPDADLEAFERGKETFGHVFTAAEGLGLGYNDTSCTNCHALPTVPGSGDYDHRSYGVGTARMGQSHGVNEGRPYRLAPPLYGIGLLDRSVLPDEQIIGHCGLQGRAVMTRSENGECAGVARFGVKPMVSTLRGFVGAAAMFEMSLTNDTCAPNDYSMHDDDGVADPEVSNAQISDITAYLGGLAAPERGEQTTAVAAGESAFTTIGCAACHRLPLGTDLCVHDMGDDLDDGSDDQNPTQVDGREWRTMHLIGAGFRPTFLHDGRATTFAEAIHAHAGEAAPSVAAYDALDATARERVLAFLSSL